MRIALALSSGVLPRLRCSVIGCGWFAAFILTATSINLFLISLIVTIIPPWGHIRYLTRWDTLKPHGPKTIGALLGQGMHASMMIMGLKDP